VSWTGAVLTGGASRRMGRDKALVEVDGQAMASRVVGALRAAGASEAFTVGGDLAALRRLGLDARPDRWPGAGPLGGIVTALHEATCPIAVVLACDLVGPDPTTVATVVRALADATAAAVVFPVADGRPQYVHGAWRVEAARPALEQALQRGEHAVHRAVASLATVLVDDLPASALADADRPDDLPAGP
jgi:molybdopterin-guanine dinucleotide biosynthesis protein A